uniref:CBS domain-containing protein n=1 Tax=Picea sitchensis TaxID=3332 RepID=D5AB13_PICSI|nr:unknown [Picea sitchensis]
MGVYSVSAAMASAATYSAGYCFCCCSIPPNSNSIYMTRFPVQLNRGTMAKLSKHQHQLSRGFAEGFRGLHINTTRLHLPKSTLMATDVPPKHEVFTVGDFMTRKENLIVVKPTTMVDEAMESLVANRITGLPVVDNDWKLVGVVSDYDLLALDSISGAGRTETGFFPQVGSTWKAFNELQNLLNKTNGKIVAEVMTPSPLVIRETTNLEDAARLLLETKYRRLPVVDNSGKLVGILTRGNVIKAALKMKRAV